MAFHEVRLDDDIALGAAGGPRFLTDVVVLDSGRESRNVRWPAERRRWDLSYAIVSQDRLHRLVAFFLARKGRAYGFRFKDWTDWFVQDEPLPLSGGPTGQLVKAYGSGGHTHTRVIQKPVSGTVSFRLNGEPYSATLDYTTGVFTLTPLVEAVITAISKANPGVVTTSSDHGFTSGQSIYLHNTGGMAEVSGRVFVIIVLSDTTFSIGENTTGYGTYSGTDGRARRYLQPGAALTWSGQFDVPVRFDTDQLPARLEAYSQEDRKGAFTLDGVPVEEIRL